MTRCEYFLVQYAPNLSGDLRLPIGLFLLEESGSLVRYRMTRDWRRIRCLDAGADLGFVAALLQQFEQLAKDHSDTRDSAFHQLLLAMGERDFGNVLISSPRAVETDDPEREFGILFREHVAGREPRRESMTERPGSRRWIHRQLQEGLERHELLSHMQSKVSVERFTAPGDSFRIDFSYAPTGTIQYLHAISLVADWNQAKVLTYTFDKIRQVQAARMTAVVDDRDAPQGTRQCAQVLLGGGIELQPLSRLDAFLSELGSNHR